LDDHDQTESAITIGRNAQLGPVHAPEPYLVVSARGQATWWRFLERGGQYPEDLTGPAG
jgi:hypothetical protein